MSDRVLAVIEVGNVSRLIPCDNATTRPCTCACGRAYRADTGQGDRCGYCPPEAAQ